VDLSADVAAAQTPSLYEERVPEERQTTKSEMANTNASLAGYLRDERWAKDVERILAAQAPAGVVDTRSKLVIMIDPGTFFSGKNRQMEILQLKFSTNNTPLGTEEVTVLEKSMFDAHVISSDPKILYQYITDGNGDMRQKLRSLLSRLGVSAGKIDLVISKFGVTIVAPPSDQGDGQYEVTNVRARLSMARIAARVHLDKILEISDRVTAFVRDMIPAIRMGEFELKEALRNMNRYNPRFKLYRRLQLKLETVRVDEMLAWIRDVVQKAIGSAA
jgi:hypothetical protein